MIKIGITSDIIKTRTANHWQTNSEGIHKRVADVVIKNGGLPFILPVAQATLIKDYLKSVDGIIITGGLDVDPYFYNEKPLSGVHPGDRNRDQFEIKLVQQAIRYQKPILGLCRGLQVINVALGGSLYQNLGTQLSQAELSRHEQTAPGNQPTHFITVKPRTNLYQSLGNRDFVNSRHHEAVKRLGHNLIISAKAPDGIIEAIESQDGLLQGIQWHPEDLYYHYPKQEQIFTDYLKRVVKFKTRQFQIHKLPIRRRDQLA